MHTVKVIRENGGVVTLDFNDNDKVFINNIECILIQADAHLPVGDIVLKSPIIVNSESDIPKPKKHEYNAKAMKHVAYVSKEIEPVAKTMLADAKVGDLCKRRDGKWVQILKRLDNNIARDINTHWAIQTNCFPYRNDRQYYGLNGIKYHDGMTSDEDIVHTEPLAPEGTAEWAWQMILLGNKVCHPYWADGLRLFSQESQEISNPDGTLNTKDKWMEFTSIGLDYHGLEIRWQLWGEK